MIMAMAIGIHKKPIQRPIKLETPLEYMTEKTLKMLLYKLSITDAAHTRIFVSHQRIVRPSPNIAPMSQYSILETIHSINDNKINLLSDFSSSTCPEILSKQRNKWIFLMFHLG